MNTQISASFYIVPMFPYPSGKLHMGHVRNYAISDTIARHYRRQGITVLHPIGWDAFGLPAENAARDNGVDPRAWTDQNIKAMRQQLNDLGFEFSSGHEIATHHPDYIKQGQSIFLKMYRAGLIERRTGEVWWDPVDNTVLANEQVIDGCGWRSGAKTERRTLPMLFANTRAQAQALSDGLEHLDWPSQAKAAQRAWIGAKDGDIRLHDWCLSRQRSWGTPIPLLNCGSCGEVPAEETSLPMLNLPTHPTQDDIFCVCPECGGAATRSTETLDTFWDSAFYACVYPDAIDNRATCVAGPGFQNIKQVDLYIGGLEHSTMHLLYARWFAHAMRKVGFDVPKEPFTRLIGQGMVCAPAYKNEQGAWIAPDDIFYTDDHKEVDNKGSPVQEIGILKMSKSKKNGVDPQKQIKRFGAESVRFAMLFAAPYSLEIAWRDEVVHSAFRHIERMTMQAGKIGESPKGVQCKELEQAAAKVRQEARKSFEGMEGVNAVMGTALGLWREAVRIAREGNGDSARNVARAVADVFWPIIPKSMETVMKGVDPTWAPGPIEELQIITFRPTVFQVNGVRRGVISSHITSPEEAIAWMREHQPAIAEKHLNGVIDKIVFVPGRIVNIVIKQDLSLPQQVKKNHP